MKTATRRILQLSSIMSQPPKPGPLNILMLHGYTQTGHLFHIKTKALEKHLLKAFPGSKFSYPTGPLRLRPSQIPGFNAEKFQSVEGEDDEVESYGWWTRANELEPIEYQGFEAGLAAIAKVIATEGPFDGVIGFSQGASAAAMVASLLESPDRKKSFESHHAKNPLAIPYPSSFANLDHPPLKFCLEYCGFRAPGPRYEAFYEPFISTPCCHILGSLDTAVDESRSRALVEACGGETKTQVIWHPGGHFVPSGKEYLNAAANFIKNCVTKKVEAEKKEESVEDMDVPF